MEVSEAKPQITKELIEESENDIDKFKFTQKNLKKSLTMSFQITESNQLNEFKYINNDDDYLELNSKYQTSSFNNSDTEKRTDSIEKKSTSNSSLSQTENNTPKRIGISNNYVLNLNYLKKNFNNIKKNISPICVYYEGIDKKLSEENPNDFDYTKTNNFISKDIYFNKNNNNNYQNDFGFLYYPFEFNYPFEQNDFNYENSIYNKKIKNLNNENNNNNKNKNEEKKSFSNSNTPSFKKYGGKFDIPLYYYNYDNKVIRGIQSTNLFCNNNSLNNKNQKKNEEGINENANSNKNQKNYFNKGRKGKPFTERSGDWVCSSCKNLNFAFRIICNRCHLPKIESEKISNEKNDNLKNNSNEKNYKSNFQKENNYVNNNKIIDVNNIYDKKQKE